MRQDSIQKIISIFWGRLETKRMALLFSLTLLFTNIWASASASDCDSFMYGTLCPTDQLSNIIWTIPDLENEIKCQVLKIISWQTLRSFQGWVCWDIGLRVYHVCGIQDRNDRLFPSPLLRLKLDVCLCQRTGLSDGCVRTCDPVPGRLLLWRVRRSPMWFQVRCWARVWCVWRAGLSTIVQRWAFLLLLDPLWWCLLLL